MRKRLWFGVLVLVVAGGAWGIGNYLGWFNRPVSSVKCIFHGDSRGLKRTVIVPALDTPMPAGKNVIWCSSFQLAWNHAQKDVIHAPILLGSAAAVANRLNRAAQSEADLPPGACYAAAGTVQGGIISTITNAMAKQFPAQQAPAFASRNADDIIAYGYLQVDAPFVNPFDILHAPLLFTDSTQHSVRLTSFGVDQWTKKEPRGRLSQRARQDLISDGARRQGVRLGFYATGGKEYIVYLNTKTGTQLILACIAPKTTLAGTVADAEAKLTNPNKYNATEEEELNGNDTFAVPNMNWQADHHFTELEGQSVANPGFTGYQIEEARQSIDFYLDHTGARLKSESDLSLSRGCSFDRSPHHLLFNRPFLMYMRQYKQGTRTQPFFAMWVDNAELLEKW